MFFRKKEYSIDPADLQRFNDFFHEYLYPNQMKNGAELVGRWTTEDHSKIIAIWKYDSREGYEQVEQSVRADPMHEVAQDRRQAMEQPLFTTSEQTFLESTGDYHHPKHIVATNAAVFNDQNDILLMKTYWRDDTWEIPGGQIELGESLHEAAIRETKEETGINCAVEGVTGVYKNRTNDIVNITFRANKTGGTLQTSKETQAVKFVSANEDTLRQYITRPHFLTRALDALSGVMVSSESYERFRR